MIELKQSRLKNLTLAVLNLLEFHCPNKGRRIERKGLVTQGHPQGMQAYTSVGQA